MGKSLNLLNNMKGAAKNIESIDSDNNIEDGLCEEETEIGGAKVSQFTFTDGTGEVLETEDTVNNSAPVDNSITISPKKTPKGITPPIDGEPFNIKRRYQFRESTIRMLNELKASHPDINVYLNTIVDTAIRHYYDYIITQGNIQK